MSEHQTQQYWLFDAGPDQSRLQEARTTFMKSARAVNTVKAYFYAWKVFSNWCTDYGHIALPATAETLQDFIAWRLDVRKQRIYTVTTDLSAIRHMHIEAGLSNPLTPEVKLLVRNAARNLRQRPQQKRALTANHLRRISEKMQSGEMPSIEIRDRAMVLVCFAAGWRGSELLSLSLADVWFEDGSLYIQLGASKTDQDGRRGRTVRIYPGENPLTCPVQALKDWLAVRGPWHGPLFCRFNRFSLLHKSITPQGLRLRLKRLLGQIGENPARFGSHSMRAGMITTSVENGADVLSIMERTGQKNVGTVMKYVRPAKALSVNPLRGVL